MSNKTWFCENGFAGCQYVFFETKNGLKKAIKQVHGSGVCVINSEIYDVEIKGEYIYMTNGLNLKTREQALAEILFFKKSTQELFKDDMLLKILSNNYKIYNWATKEFCDTVSYRRLKDLSLALSEIYNLETVASLPL